MIQIKEKKKKQDNKKENTTENTADEMFEELGYEKKHNYSDEVKYQKNKYYEIQITLLEQNKWQFAKYCYIKIEDGRWEYAQSEFIDEEEGKAIYKKIEELKNNPEKLNLMSEANLRIAPSKVASKIYEEIMADYEK